MGAVSDAGSLAGMDVAALNTFLRQDLFRPRSYRRPVDLAAEWANTGQ
jgi:hypothetical protein